jgi:uncharacterized membrane protein
MQQDPTSPPPPHAADTIPAWRIDLWAGLAGFGLAGLFDGILLHRLLRWHHLLSGARPDLTLSAQALADAGFDAAMYLALLVGITGGIIDRAKLARLHRRCIAGILLMGFGLWNLADALVAHWLLGLHHIWPKAENPLLWDVAWLATFGILPLVIGRTMRATVDGAPPA